MYAYKEFKIAGLCPYCQASYETIVNSIPIQLAHQCSNCKRGLSIIPGSNGFATVESGLPNQSIAVIASLQKGCCGHD
jgi:hypothetical protein